MIIDVITIFPQMFKPVIEESIVKRAQQKGLVEINLINLRDYSGDPHRKVDGPPYGGGPGMVFKCQPLFSAVEDVLRYKVYPKKKRKDSTKRIILFTPKGRLLNQELIRKFLRYHRLILLAPRYEGVDERVRRYLVDDEVSIGDYILSGGELPCMVFIDCLVRLLPGVVSNFSSVKRESFQDYLLDYPVYTRPRDFRGLKVPKVLLSGDHSRIEKWRMKKAEELTKNLRPDLWKKRVDSKKSLLKRRQRCQGS